MAFTAATRPSILALCTIIDRPFTSPAAKNTASAIR
jgi:hypothetical protein